MKTTFLFLTCTLLLLRAGFCFAWPGPAPGPGPLFVPGPLIVPAPAPAAVVLVPQRTAVVVPKSTPAQRVVLNGIVFDLDRRYNFYTWTTLPSTIKAIRQPLHKLKAADGTTHWYQAVYVPTGNLNWFQAAYLAQDAGGYLASITTAQENNFVFRLVQQKKFFWRFPQAVNGGANNYQTMIGPFLGGYQVADSLEPAGGWQWLSGEPMVWSNWAMNLDDGVIDRDPRDNTQPNDSSEAWTPQRIMGFGVMSVPVSTWADYVDDVGTPGMAATAGQSHGFVIEYDTRPNVPQSASPAP